MANPPWGLSNITIREKFNRTSYVLNKDDHRGWNVFHLLYNGNQSYYSFEKSCDVEKIARTADFSCYTIAADNQSIAVVHNLDFFRTGYINVTIHQNSSDPHSTTTMFLAPQIDMKRFMFPIFAIEQNQRRLLAQVNAVPSGSSKLPIPDAYTFNVDITEGINQKETELVLMLCIMIDNMRDYMIDEYDDKEDFYNND